MEKNPFFISTSIPYVNAAPHIGHALEFVEADAIARFERLKGSEVYFLSGTDDNALKNVLKAEEAGEETRVYVERHAKIFKDLLSALNISNDDFIQTSVDKRHTDGAQKLWSSLKPEDITKKKYEGLYCVGCEEFKTENDLHDGECPEHPGKKPEVVSEENYFFVLGHYTDTLISLIEADELKIIPNTRKNEVLSFLKGGLVDLSISRSVERARGWGVKVPSDNTQVMYVWVDALSNYITALGYAYDDERFKKYWQGNKRIVHVIGKGISRFHAVYWPALLLSAGIPLPRELFVHGYITVGGQKISKSLGNTIDPFALIEEYGADAFRYYMLRETSPFEDGDYTAERFKEVYNANLANGLGNLVSRVLKLSSEHIESIEKWNEEIPEVYAKAIEEYRLHDAMDYIWKRIKDADQKITDTEPFKLIKTDATGAKKILRELVEEVARIGFLLAPFLPETSEKILQAVRDNKKPESLFVRKE